MFEYTSEWAEKIYSLTKKKPIENEEEIYLVDLYKKADYTKDIKAVAALIKCLEIPATGREQSIYGTLSTIE